MRDRERLPVGTAVIIRRRYGSAEPVPARIVKVGRTLYHVLRDQWADKPDRTETFRIDTRMSDDGAYYSVETTAEAERRERRDEAVRALREAGIEFRIGGDRLWSDDAVLQLHAAVEQITSAGSVSA